VKGYIDGKLVVEQTPTISTVVDKAYIGSLNIVEPHYFNGLIDDVRIYNYARTADEIKQDYNSGYSTYFE
jgi:hypothetical protein